MFLLRVTCASPPAKSEGLIILQPTAADKKCFYLELKPHLIRDYCYTFLTGWLWKTVDFLPMWLKWENVWRKVGTRPPGPPLFYCSWTVVLDSGLGSYICTLLYTLLCYTYTILTTCTCYYYPAQLSFTTLTILYGMLIFKFDFRFNGRKIAFSLLASHPSKRQ